MVRSSSNTSTKSPEDLILVDISKDALDVARTDIKHYGLEAYVKTVESDLWKNVPQDSQFDVIISNPPYVPTASMNNLPKSTHTSHSLPSMVATMGYYWSTKY